MSSFSSRPPTVGRRAKTPIEPVTVVPDATIESAQAFVESYNNLMSYIDSQARFTAETEDAGPLLGNRAVIRIQDDLRLLLTESIGGLNPSLNRLTAAGFSLDDKGRTCLPPDPAAARDSPPPFGRVLCLGTLRRGLP